ncbi:MAG: hypothetical protein N3D14_06090 [Aquificaceae bacterium]|nr:hypothetical protein [Aquificaceae bacterium]
MFILFYHLSRKNLFKAQTIHVLENQTSKKLKSIVDGAILPLAKVYRGREKRIKRCSGRVFGQKGRWALKEVFCGGAVLENMV